MAALGMQVFGAMALVAGPVLFVRSFRDLRLSRLVQNTPTARIRSLSMGLVEIHGEVVPRSRLEAPFSGRPCAYWELDVATRSRRRGWGVVHRASSGHPFFVRDDTGLALVYPQGARLEVQNQVEEECLGLALPGCYAHYLDGLGGAAALWRYGPLRFRERVLEDEEPLYVLGTATPRAQAVTLTPGDEFEGEATGTDEWRARRLRTLDHDATAVIRRGEHEHAFILSSQSERMLTSTLGLHSALGLVAGPALSLFGLAVVLNALQSHVLSR